MYVTTILEGVWDCSNCGEKAISGDLTRCPECGDPCDAAFNPEEDFYLPPDAKVVSKPDEIAEALMGPNWTCGNCGEMNKASVNACVNCGEALGNNDRKVRVTDYVDGEAARDVTLSTPEDLKKDWADATLRGVGPEQVLATTPVEEPRRSLPMSDLPTHAPGSPYMSDSRSKKAPMKIFSGLSTRTIATFVAIGVTIALLIGVCIWVYQAFIATHTVDVTVKSLSWERSIEVEDFRTLTQSDWSVPSDGRVISSHLEVRSYVQVLDHYETKYRTVTERVPDGSHTDHYACGTTRTNLGNGKFSTSTKYCDRTVQDYKNISHQESYQDPVYRNQPVYDTKFTYQVDRWVFDHWATANGTESPYWPTVSLNGSKERIGDERQEHYRATVADSENRQFTEDAPDQSTWERVHTGMVLKGEQTNAGMLVSVNWP